MNWTIAVKICQIDKHTSFVGLINTYLALQISKDCLPAIMKLPNLEVLALVGCVGIDDDALSGLENECSKSLRVIIKLDHFVSCVGVVCHVLMLPSFDHY